MGTAHETGSSPGRSILGIGFFSFPHLFRLNTPTSPVRISGVMPPLP
jgi:hypothetical protein